MVDIPHDSKPKHTLGGIMAFSSVAALFGALIALFTAWWCALEGWWSPSAREVLAGAGAAAGILFCGTFCCLFQWYLCERL